MRGRSRPGVVAFVMLSLVAVSCTSGARRAPLARPPSSEAASTPDGSETTSGARATEKPSPAGSSSPSYPAAAAKSYSWPQRPPRWEQTDGGHLGTNDSFLGDLSADGRFVAFSSYAANLVLHDTNRSEDCFIRDGATGHTSRVSVGVDGRQLSKGGTCEGLSNDGRFIVMTLSSGLYRRDRMRNMLTRVSVSNRGAAANRPSTQARISADGRFVAFVSEASNLVSGGSDDRIRHVYVRDVLRKTTELVSVSEDGQGIPGADISISGDGRFIAFIKGEGNHFHQGEDLPLLIRDRVTGTTIRAASGADAGGHSNIEYATLSSDGRHVVYDRDGRIYVFDRPSGHTALVSRSACCAGWRLGISSDGRKIAFTSTGDEGVPGEHQGETIYLYDRRTKRMTRETGTVGDQPYNEYTAVVLDSGGRYLAFHTIYLFVPDKRDQPDCSVPSGDRETCFDVYVHEIDSGKTFAVSRSSSS